MIQKPQACQSNCTAIMTVVQSTTTILTRSAMLRHVTSVDIEGVLQSIYLSISWYLHIIKCM